MSNEAAAIGTLYREVSAYPDPERGVLQKDLVDYTDNLLTVAFPGLQNGEDPPGGTAIVTRFQDHLLAFQPGPSPRRSCTPRPSSSSPSSTTSAASASTPPPAACRTCCGGVIVLGAALNLVLLCLFSLSTRGAHLLLGGLFAFFLGTMIFLIAALDYPFRGDLSVSPEPVETMYHNVMGHGAQPPPGSASSANPSSH